MFRFASSGAWKVHRDQRERQKNVREVAGALGVSGELRHPEQRTERKEVPRHDLACRDEHAGDPRAAIPPHTNKRPIVERERDYRRASRGEWNRMSGLEQGVRSRQAEESRVLHRRGSRRSPRSRALPDPRRPRDGAQEPADGMEPRRRQAQKSGDKRELDDAKGSRCRVRSSRPGTRAPRARCRRPAPGDTNSRG